MVDVPNSVTCLNHAWNVVNWVGVAPQTDTKKTHVFKTYWTACSKCDDYFRLSNQHNGGGGVLKTMRKVAVTFIIFEFLPFLK